MPKKIIYAEDAIDAAECIVEHHSITPYKTMAAAMDHLKRIFNGMPSAQPKRIKGRWTEKTVTENPQACGIREWQSAKCSVCGKYHSTPYLYSFTEYAFCPTCGSDMRGEDDE